jgi:phosphatidate cytidylyltransferase
MLRWRLLSAGAILTVLITLMVLDYQQAGGTLPGAWLLPWMVLVSLLGAEEVLSLLAARDLRPTAWPVYTGASAVTIAFAWPVWSDWWSLPAEWFRGDVVSFPSLILALAVTLVLAVEMRRYDAPGQHVVHLALSVFTIVYVGVLGGFLVALRLIGGNESGMTAVVSCLLIVKTSDIGAFAFGRLLGANKLAPRLSAGKTIEGAIGGIATACVVSWAFFRFAAPQLMPSLAGSPPTYLATMLYGLILAAAAIIGDLAESLLKRDMGRKDSSTWLPGLGGVLDIMDSLLVAAPAAYVCWQWGLIP